MKKTIAIILALITLLSVLSVALVACKDNTPPANNDDEDDGAFVSKNDPDDDENDKTNEGEGEGKGEGEGEGNTNAGGWTEREGTLYVMANNLYIRKTTNKADGYYRQANIGESFAFTATNGNWYKITYNDKEAYISATFVTEEKEAADFESGKLTEAVVLEIEAHADKENPYRIALRDNAALEDSKGDKYITRENTLEGELKKLATNAKGNIWKVEYQGEVYYIGAGAFKYFDGKPNTGNSENGVG